MSVVPWLHLSHHSKAIVLSEWEDNLSIERVAGFQDGQQKPQCITLVGRNTKNNILKYMLARDGCQSFEPHGQVRLSGDPCPRKGTEPVLFVDFELYHHVSSHDCDPGPEATVTKRAVQGSPSGQTACKHVSSKLLSRLFTPLSNVICYFVSDLGGLRSVAQLLARQAVDVSPALSASRILLVVDTTDAGFQPSIYEDKAVRFIVEAMGLYKSFPSSDSAETALKAHFHDIRVLGLRTHTSHFDRSKVLRKRLLADSHHIQDVRKSRQALYTFTHLRAFAGVILDNVCQSRKRSVDLLKASRPAGFTIDRFPANLSDLLQQMPSQAWLWHFMVPWVSSALMLENYRPGCHRFESDLLFDHLYASRCRGVLQQYTIDGQVTAKFLRDVKAQLRDLLAKLVDGQSLLELHRARLRELAPSLQLCGESFKHRGYCSCCLMRAREKVLDCGHTLCRECIVTFGHSTPQNRHRYLIPRCLICQETVSIPLYRCIPPTAGIRVLSLDGGGVRGVVPLTFLSWMTDRLGYLACPIDEHFDLVVGTSAGGLIAMGLFLMNWPVEECLAKFESLAQQTFRRRKGQRLLGGVRSLITNIVQDYRYSSSPIEEAFKPASGASLAMFNATNRGTKVAVTTTRAGGEDWCLIANYNNAPGDEGQEARDRRLDDSISISNAASCTSAAPFLFPAKYLPGHGTFQDGALQHNNPMPVAMDEGRKLWPRKDDPDFFLSIGTGTATQRYAVDSSKPVLDRSLSVFLRHGLAKFNGEHVWIDCSKAQPPKTRARCHRLDIKLAKETGIDCLATMRAVKRQTEEELTADAKLLDPILRDVVASSFYFELDQIPCRDGNTLRCSGHVYCRLGLAAAGTTALYRHMREKRAFFDLNTCRTLCVGGGRGPVPFRRHLTFTVSSRDEEVSLKMGGIVSPPQSIGGFPTTVRRLIDDQRLYAPFGRTDHVSDEKPLPLVPQKRSRERVSA